MVTHVGTIKGKVLYKGRNKMPIMLKDVKIVPGLVKNLFSLSTVMRNGWDISTKQNKKIK